MGPGKVIEVKLLDDKGSIKNETKLLEGYLILDIVKINGNK